VSAQSDETASYDEQSPIAVLEEEHALILRALDVLEAGLARVEAGVSVSGAFFGDLAEFFRTFADRHHHGKEEEILFRYMVEEMDYSPRSGPVGVLSSEHKIGRAHVRAMSEAASLLEADPDSARRLVDEGRAYLSLLRAHIEREDHKVFPVVEDFLGPEERAALMAAFFRFESAEGGTDASAKYSALIDRWSGGDT
jgi:hemerythrin-like domain-containing protein